MRGYEEFPLLGGHRTDTAVVQHKGTTVVVSPCCLYSAILGKSPPHTKKCSDGIAFSMETEEGMMFPNWTDLEQTERAKEGKTSRKLSSAGEALVPMSPKVTQGE